VGRDDQLKIFQFFRIPYIFLTNMVRGSNILKSSDNILGKKTFESMEKA